MADVLITKLNESAVEIDASEDILHNIYTMFSEYVAGFQFAPTYKARRWDGKIHLFNMKTQSLPIGLMGTLTKFFEKTGTTYELTGFRYDEFKEELNEEEYKAIIADNMKNCEFTIRDYQDKAVRAALENHRGILLSCTSSGKSLMLFNIIKTILKKNFKKVLLIVPNIMLVDQMYDDFADYGWENIEENVERLGGGHEACFDKPVLISTWQSLQNKEDDFFEQFDGVFVDETHGVRGDVLTKIIKLCTNARMKIGTTGTLPTDKADNLKIKAVLGDVIFELKSKELIDLGVLTKIKIANMILKYPDEFIKKHKGRNYNEEVRMVESYENRNIAFKKILDHTDKTHNILVLMNHIKHIKDIKEWCEKNYPDRKVSIITGEVKATDRSEIRTNIENEEGTILLASFQTCSTGINMPKLHEVVLYSNSKSKIKVLQSIGRGLRKHKTKNQIILYDLVDDLSYKTKTGKVVENYLVKHWHERMTYYKEQEFPTITTTINI